MSHIQRWLCFVDMTVGTRVLEQYLICGCFQSADFEQKHSLTEKHVVDNKTSNVQLT